MSNVLEEYPGKEVDNSTASELSSLQLSVQNPEVDIRNESLANIEILVLSIILFLAIVGNSLMLLALRRQLKYRPMSRMYFFMFHLSVADLLVAFGNILPQLAWDITYRFLGNDLLCRTVKFCQVFVLYLSTYVLTGMAVDRYLVVCHHSFARTHYNVKGIKGPKFFVGLSWVIAFVFATPQCFIFGLKEVKVGVDDCWGDFIEPWGQKAYVIWFVTSAFVLPLFLIGLSYGAICYKVMRFNLPRTKKSLPGIHGRNKGRNKHTSFSSPGQSELTLETPISTTPPPSLVRAEEPGLNHQISEAKIKSVKLTLTVILCFIVCWAPFCITQLIMTFNPPLTMQTVDPINVILLLLASLNSCTNPWIYLAFSESLFNQLRICLGCGFGRGSCDYSIGDEQNENPNPPLMPKPICRIVIEPVGNLDLESNGGDPCPIVETKKVETKSEII